MDRIKLKDEVIGARDLDVKYEEIFLPERLAGAKRPSPLGVTKSRHLTLQGSELTRSHSAFIKIVWNLPSNIKSLADVSYLGFRLLGATCPWPMGAIMSRLSALPGGCALIALKVKTNVGEAAGRSLCDNIFRIP
uniref:SFRICE_036155 n=1 Tax=Spodoptera frugiperda TaxID=7108 RepID=A0A2H1WYM5_SPOFR